MKLLWKPRVRPAEPARPRAFCQGSWMVIFWCKCGVNRKDRFRKMLTYQAFPPSGSYPAVAHEKYFYHLFITPHKFYISSQMLDITGFFTLYTLSVLSPVLKII